MKEFETIKTLSCILPCNHNHLKRLYNLETKRKPNVQ